MSSDIFALKESLEAAGVEFSTEYDKYLNSSCSFATFPDRALPYEVLINNGYVCISCSGDFRNWLQHFLNSNSIEYDMY